MIQKRYKYLSIMVIETQMDILTDTRYLVPKIYSIVIGHAGIPPKKSVMAMLNSSFQKSWSKWHMVCRVYTIQEIFFSIAQLLHGA